VANLRIVDLRALDISAEQQLTRPQSVSPAVVIDRTALSRTVIYDELDLQQSSVRRETSTQTAQNPIQQELRVKPFASYQSSISNYPNDVVRLDIYNAVDQYLETDYRVASFTKNGMEVTLDPETDLSNLNYISGRYRVDYKFHRNILGSGDGHKLQVQEISADGLEVRVIPVLSSTITNVDFISFFESALFTIPKAQVLPNLNLFKDANTSVRVFDYVQDKFTFSLTPYSIIFKLSSPIPSDIIIGDFIWIAQQVSENFSDNITIVPPKVRSTKIKIAGPNWDVINKDTTSTSTQYKDWDDLLTTNTQTSNNIVNSLLSSSALEGIQLNIDYRNFENHIQFGSATERLLNFKYKMQLVESYDARINALTTDLNGLPSSSVSSSLYFQSNVQDSRNKKTALLGSFDGYEKYLYYESSSYQTSSYGEFYPSTWPKSNSSKPYTNYAVNSTQVEDWFDGIYSSASLFDQNNDKALYKLVPAHILEDSANEEYTLFSHMIGHYYDLMYSYIKQMTKTYNRDESLLEGFSKELVYHVSKNLGVDFENGNNLEELWSYALGADASGSLSSTYGISNEDKTKEVWKRIVNNLPYLLKTRGTERGVRALINCFGIPQTILRIREYGGAEPDFDTKTDLQYERFNYSTVVGYNGRTTGTNAAQSINIPFQALANYNSLRPMTIEVRAKMAKNQTKEQRLLETGGPTSQWLIKAFKSGSGDYLGFFLSGSAGYATSSVSCSIYDGAWHHIALRREVLTDLSGSDQTYTLIVKKTNYQKVVGTYTSSLFINGTTSASYNKSFVTASISRIWLPASLDITSPSAATSQSMTVWSGSVQEFRYWSTPLQDSILDNHALTPTSFQGNLVDTHTGSTSSFYTLAYRLPLGSDNNRKSLVEFSGNLNTYLSSSHPNQTKQLTGTLASFYFSSGSPSPRNYLPETEIHSLEWPDLGGNRSIGNKIRIDNTFLAGENNQLYRNTSVLRASSDNQPIDSSRLGIYLSPTNETNQDIAEQFGGLSIDDFIGNPSNLDDDSYPDLELLQREYFKKYSRKGAVQNYIKLLRYYDAALFKMIKRFVPYRANTQVGLVIEPHLLHRSKVSTKAPTFEDLTYTGSLDMGPETFINVGGFVQDGDGEPFRNMEGYVQEGKIGGDESYYINISGEAEQVLQLTDVDGIDLLPVLDDVKYDMVVIDGTSVPTKPSLTGDTNTTLKYYQDYSNGTLLSHSKSEGINGTVDLALTAYGRDTRVQGSQYIFMSYMQSGSGATISAPYLFTSSRYDYHECLPPVIQTSRYSEISNVSANIYDMDIYGGRAFTDETAWGFGATSNTTTLYTSSEALQTNNWTVNYGLDIVSLYIGTTLQSTPLNTQAYWFLRSNSVAANDWGLGFGTTIQSQYTASIRVPAFFYKADDPSTWNYLYEVTIAVNEDVSYPNILELHYGDLDCGVTSSITPTTTLTTNTFITKATGTWLGLRLYANTNGYPQTNTYIPKLQVKCLNYRADVQDFHLRDSYGMRNARYDGCKLTSTDWNIDSPDTTDGGPVVTVTVGGGKQLSVEPSVRGTFRTI